MGIRSLIYFKENVRGKIITYVVIYQNIDGYPKCVGLVLAHFLKQIFDLQPSFSYSIAQFIAQEIGNGEKLYIVSPEVLGDTINWEYHVTCDNDNINITANHTTSGKTFVNMSIDQFLQYCCDDGNYNIDSVNAIMFDRVTQLTKIKR